MRYAIKVNHFSFRFARCRLVSRVAFPSFRAVTLIAIHTKSNLVPLRPAHRFECPPPLHPFDYCLCCLLLASSLSFLFFCCLCPLGTFNFWRSFVVIFLDLQIVANLIINNSSQLASLTLFREEAHHSII